MSSIVIKVGSLVIKTLSKPIANRIKAQAREHERFRRVCVNVAQGIHRWDMRFRLGLLQDTAAIEKQIAKDAAEAKKPPTVKTEAQTKADEARAKDPEKGKDAPKKKPKIRPLSEAKAIDLGANFVSETFLLGVGIALILFENARRGRQEANKREDLTDRLDQSERERRLLSTTVKKLDREVMNLRLKTGTSAENNHSLFPKELHVIEEEEEDPATMKPKGWLSRLSGLFGGRNSGVETPEPVTIKAPEILSQYQSRDDSPKSTNETIESKPIPAPNSTIKESQITNSKTS